MILLKLLGAWGWLKQALGAVLSLVQRYPLQTALIASLCLSGWLWRGKQEALAERDLTRTQYADCIKAGQDALAKQIALNNQTKAKYEAAAKEADHEHEKALALANDRSADYLKRNRLRPKEGGGWSRAPSPSPTSQGPGVSENTAEPSVMVAITEDDFNRCTALYPYALGAHEWAKDAFSESRDLGDSHKNAQPRGEPE